MIFDVFLCMCAQNSNKTSWCYHVSLYLGEVYRVLSEYSIAARGYYRFLDKGVPPDLTITTL